MSRFKKNYLNPWLEVGGLQVLISISLVFVIPSSELLSFFLHCRLEVSSLDDLFYQRPSS